MSVFRINDVAMKIWLPEAMDDILRQLSDAWPYRRPWIIRDTLFVYTYGQYRFAQMKAEQDGFFWSDPNAPLFSRTCNFHPELGKNIKDYKVWLPTRLRNDLKTMAERSGMARADVSRPQLPSDHFCRVWRHERACRRLAATTPQLMPLFGALLANREPTSSENPVTAMRRAFRQEGLTRAAWRYVVRHGGRIFRVPWEMSRHQSAWSVAVAYLHALYQAGLPPPPPASVVRAWLRMYGAADWDGLYFRPGWCDVPGDVLSIALREADRMRRSPNLNGFVDEFLLVMLWACDTRPCRDKNQYRTGWTSLVRRASNWNAHSQAQARRENRSWQTSVSAFDCHGALIKPLLSTADLVTEGHLMRNCIANYEEDCSAGLFRIWSVWETKQKRPTAHIGVYFDELSQRWELGQCKGFANQPVDHRINHWGARLYVDITNIGLIK